YITGSQVTVLDGMPFCAQEGVGDCEVVLLVRIPPQTVWTASAVNPITYLRLPLMSFRASPPHAPVTPSGHISGGQILISRRVPLLRQVFMSRDKTGRLRHLPSGTKGATVTIGSFTGRCLPLVVIGVWTLPPNLLAAACGNTVRG